MNINKGSIETIIVDVTDELANLDALPAGTTYFINDTDDVQVVAPQVATVSGLRAKCLVDTTNLPLDTYELFVTFSSPPDNPVLGPHRFRVV